MQNIKYSIITANYNGYHLMEKYFESLENQTYKNFEILIIDDCSTDDSYKELLKYQKASKLDIKLFKTKENSGPGVARNIGIDNATGEYITFIDNDDWVEKGLLESINNILLEKMYDCVVFDYSLDSKNNSRAMSSMYGNFNGEINKGDAIKYIRNHTVCKFYKTTIIKQNKLHFPDLKRHEDIAFVATTLVHCSSFYYLKKTYYHYVQRTNSLSNANDLDVSSVISAFSIVERELKKEYYNELIEKSVPDLLYGTCLIMSKQNKKNNEIIDFINKYEKKYSNWYNSKIITYMGKAKKIYLLLIKCRLVIMMKIVARIHTIMTSM